jgi:hypothetical protein
MQLDVANGGRGYDKIVLAPQVWTPEMNTTGSGICPVLSSVSGSMVTARGPMASSWQCPGPGGTCGITAEKSMLHLHCPAGTTISKIDFASFGTPSGTCETGFQTDPKCDTNTSEATVGKLCLGKESCDVTATSQAFGRDPCFGVIKKLAAQVSCTGTFCLFDRCASPARCHR